MSGSPAAVPRGDSTEQAFDLNIEKVLEHWTMLFAIRELIANALDEQALTSTAEPAIFKDGDGGWHITGHGGAVANRRGGRLAVALRLIVYRGRGAGCRRCPGAVR